MAKFRVVYETQPDGWSDWIQPIMRGYKMSCCDCGLVHDLEFQVLRVTKNNVDGTWQGKPLDIEKYRVDMRARRNSRSTASARRNRPGRVTSP